MPSADLILANGKFTTLDRARPQASAVAIADLHGATIELADNHPGLIVVVSFPA
ncbi:MAG TPA: hypothetical protein VM659_17225 [Dongiaceae bacterium]|nr:hypothetical protein [Dongiaceae bacterium]